MTKLVAGVLKYIFEVYFLFYKKWGKFEQDKIYEKYECKITSSY